MPEFNVPSGWEVYTPSTVADVFSLFGSLDHGDWVFRGECGLYPSRMSSLGRGLDQGAQENELVRSEALAIQLYDLHAFPLLRMQEHEFQENILDKLILMQHHGAPTRLLDWTYSPWVSLYHAISSADKRDEHSIIWCINNKLFSEQTPQSWIKSVDQVFGSKKLSEYESSLSDVDPFVVFFSSTTATERMLAQQATFSYATPVRADHVELMTSISPQCGCVISINNRHIKRRLMLELVRANITASTLFPTLDGVGQHVNDHLDWGLSLTVGGRPLGE